MALLDFIVAFKAKERSKNWEEDCLLLQQTLHSLCNQRDPDFKVWVIYTDKPEINYNSEKVTFAKFPFPVLTKKELIAAEIEHNPDFDPADPSHSELDFDKSKRIMFGCQLAKEAGCEFLMSVDADDLISNKLVSYIQRHKEENYGWFVNKGYMFRGKEKLLIRVKKNLHFINGSTNIVNSSLVPSVELNSRISSDFSFFHAHGFLSDRILCQYGESLKPLPFYATMYVLHSSSLSGYINTLGSQRLKTLAKTLLWGKRLTSQIKLEFGINEA